MIRPATEQDAAAIAAIYAPYVTDTAISFEDVPPTSEEMATRISSGTAACWLVCERDGRVAGYAYADVFHARPAYRWSTEVSVYVDSQLHRSGIGRELTTALLAELRAAGYVNAFAGIALPNAASAGLFESLGFRQAATYESVGFKLGQWHDVGWWQLPLQDATVPPPQLRPRT